jgi:hypothetical protein
MSVFECPDNDGALVLSVFIPADAERLLEASLNKVTASTPEVAQLEAADIIFAAGMAAIQSMNRQAIKQLIASQSTSQ